MTSITAPSRPGFAPWLLAGLLAFVPHLVAVTLATFQRPGLDHRTRFLGELGERGSSTAFLVNYLGIVPTGLLFAVFGAGLLLRHRSQRLLVIAGGLVVLRAARALGGPARA